MDEIQTGKIEIDLSDTIDKLIVAEKKASYIKGISIGAIIGAVIAVILCITIK